MSEGKATCPLCQFCSDRPGPGDDKNDWVKIGETGVNGINAASDDRGVELVVVKGTMVHKSCRKFYTHKTYVKKSLESNKGESETARKRSTRTSSEQFEIRRDCLFCGTMVKEPDPKHYLRDVSKSITARTDKFSQNILDICNDRADDWALVVKGRVEYCGGDLHAFDCKYHRTCSANFRSGRQVPGEFRVGPSVAKQRKAGKPKNEDQLNAFEIMCLFFEQNDEEQFTISALSDIMQKHLSNPDSGSYSNRYLKTKLKERYGDSIIVAEGEGCHDIVTMRERSSDILRSYFRSAGKGDEEAQKKEIIQTAAKLIKSDIKTNVTSTLDVYPQLSELDIANALRYIPESLRILLESLFVGKDTRRKEAAVGQAIVQAVRPRAVITPLQIGLAVQAHHLFRSRFLVDSLSAMGFCASYHEVQRFEKNAAAVTTPDVLGEDVDILEMSLLFAADNVDHDTITLDGKGTFHGMGIVAATTPKQQLRRTIPRKPVSSLNTTEETRIDIIEYRFAKHASRSIVFKDLPALSGCESSTDIMWELSLNFSCTTPQWQGMMHILHQGKQHPGQSSVVFLPMINLPSSDMTCILSTLEYVSNLAFKHHFPPVLTFDQPLYWKANEIVYDAPERSHLKDIVLLLGSFHTFMNLLGAIGTLMAGSGLKDLLETVYGERPVVHMLSGKAVQRSFRGHLLIDRCLNEMVVSELAEEDSEFASLVTNSEEEYKSCLACDSELNSDKLSETHKLTKDKLCEKRDKIAARSKTSKLWFGYQCMVKIARNLIRADRSGSWNLHLQTVADCLPIFAAAGHYNYLKSAYLYLQSMNELDVKQPIVHEKFMQGLHVVRRTNQYWTGLGSDLVIEQTLMRSLKTAGGLTHGSGMTEEQRTLWTLSRPVTSAYNEAMQEFMNRTYSTSEQHKESTKSRIKRDLNDLNKLQERLKTCSPFTEDPSLRNIITGVVANDNVNVHHYQEVGNDILKKMHGQRAFSYSFKRRDSAKTLGSASAVKVSEDRSIDPALLFQRLLIVAQWGELSLLDTMEYELCPYPPALFESKDTLRKADKPALADAIHSLDKQDDANKDDVPKTDHYVLDGGSLLHRLNWKNGDTYGSIAANYATFTVKQYGKATVVFDGYSDRPTIKDNTHKRRGHNNNNPKVNLTATSIFSGKKEDFLAGDSNKQAIVDLIAERLEKSGCKVVKCEGDADVDIAKAAVKQSRETSTTLIGEDTDLLVLLLYYVEVPNKGLFFRSDKMSLKSRKVYDISYLRDTLGDDICDQLLFLHAFTGCDSTSRIHGIGKKSVFQKLIKGNQILQSSATVFSSTGSTKDEVQTAGCQAMVHLYGGKPNESLATLRHKLLTKKVATSKTFVSPEKLPPTLSASEYHSRRTFYQTMVWMGKDEGMDPINWGWRLDNRYLVPVTMQKDPAPKTLLVMIHCNCSTGCQTARCTCKRYGLPCTAACGPCQTDSGCQNVASIIEDPDDEDDDSNDTD